ncbi:MAG TPA: UvrD-helicase domain-containing protein [Vicinamibacterales bacterium]|nr:UvrD-helicase domain-containing protein [Vicinamibacterales bacterium]
MSTNRTPTTTRLPFDGAPGGARPIDAADRAAAVDPRENVVLEASAGTGKTRVLVDRYINLLRAGVDPANILAITFTRKAAAEMRERILTSLRDAAARGEIPPARWRELRARLGDVAISTIDAFCLSLLREFPLEADLDPDFRMADETEAVRLLDESLDRAIRACRAIALSDPAVELVIGQLGDAALRDALATLIDRRLVAGPAFRRVMARGGAEMTPDAICREAASRLRDALLRVDGGVERFLADGPVYHRHFAIVAHDIRMLAAEHAGDGAAWVRRFRVAAETLRDHLLTRDGRPRARWSRYSARHAVSADAWRRHRARAAELAPAVADALARFNRDMNAVLARGAARVYAVALSEYRRTLEAHGTVDFAEALSRALDLLRQMDEFANSRYLLETQYHHLLVDEFQDTSEAQWELVWRLVEAWGAGIGTAEGAPLEPSIFVVGDRKQSIYGFRDADPTVLERAAVSISRLRPEGRVRRAIRTSFRATPSLLAFVNDLFDAVEKGGREDAFRYTELDRFPVESDASPATEPVLGLVTGADAAIVADRVAAEITRILAWGPVRDKRTGLSRPARPADIAILFRSREGHQAFEEALEARGVPAYVYKGLGFFDAPEIKDVFALLRYLANPASDLRAAAFLRSRFVRLSDAALQRLAPHLAASLRQPVESEPALDPGDRACLRIARQSVARWLEEVDRIPPAELLDAIMRESAYMWELAGPRAAQARENIKKLRDVMRRIQNRGYATIGRIAAHLDRLSAGDESNAVIDAADSVSLMTVHAAKGLEFPVVFVVNLGRGAGGARPPIRIAAHASDEEPAVAIGEYASEVDEDAAARELEETKRLLYVAVTRARDRLYLSAVVGEKGFRPARGSLGSVLPATIVDLITRVSQPGWRGEAEWRGASGRHRFLVCGDAPKAPRQPRAGMDVPLDLEPIRDVPLASSAVPPTAET